MLKAMNWYFCFLCAWSCLSLVLNLYESKRVRAWCLRLLLQLGNKPNKFPRLPIATISHLSMNVLWSTLVAFRHYRLCHEFFWAIIAFLPLWFFITCYNLWTSSTKFLFAIVSLFLSHATWFWGLKFSTKDLLFSNDTILNQNSVR